MRKLKIACISLLVLFLAGLLALVLQPNHDLTLIRELPSARTASEIDQDLRQLPNWPKWFHELESAQAVDIMGRPYPLREQTVMKGEMIQLVLDPGKGPSRKYEIDVQVLDYVPQHLLRLEVLRDSKNRLKKLFDHLEWTIEVNPWTGPPPRNHLDAKTWVRGTSSGHTAHWRARVFGAVAEKILMNQVLYPNVLSLAGLELPNPPSLYAPNDR